MIHYAALKDIMVKYHSSDKSYKDLLGCTKSWELGEDGHKLLTQTDAELILSILDHNNNPTFVSYLAKCFQIKGLYKLASISACYHQEASLDYIYREDADDIHNAFSLSAFDNDDHKKFIEKYNSHRVIDAEKINLLGLSEAIPETKRIKMREYLNNFDIVFFQENNLLVLITAFINYIDCSQTPILKREREQLLIGIMIESKEANYDRGSCAKGIHERLLFAVSLIMQHERDEHGGEHDHYYRALIDSYFRPLINEEATDEGIIVRPSELLIKTFIYSNSIITGEDKKSFFTIKRDFRSHPTYSDVFNRYSERKSSIRINIFNQAERDLLTSLSREYIRLLAIDSLKESVSVEEARELLRSIEDQLKKEPQKSARRTTYRSITAKLSQSIRLAEDFKNLPIEEKHNKIESDLINLIESYQDVDLLDERIPGSAIFFEEKILSVYRVEQLTRSDEESLAQLQAILPCSCLDLMALFPDGLETLKQCAAHFMDCSREVLFTEEVLAAYKAKLSEYNLCRKTPLIDFKSKKQPRIDTLGSHLHHLLNLNIHESPLINTDDLRYLANFKNPKLEELIANCIKRPDILFGAQQNPSTSDLLRRYAGIKAFLEAIDYQQKISGKIIITPSLLDGFSSLFKKTIKEKDFPLALLLAKHLGFKIDDLKFNPEDFFMHQHELDSFVIKYFLQYSTTEKHDTIFKDKERIIKETYLRILTSSSYALNNQTIKKLIPDHEKKKDKFRKLTAILNTMHWHESLNILLTTLYHWLIVIGNLAFIGAFPVFAVHLFILMLSSIKVTLDTDLGFLISQLYFPAMALLLKLFYRKTRLGNYIEKKSYESFNFICENSLLNLYFLTTLLISKIFDLFGFISSVAGKLTDYVKKTNTEPLRKKPFESPKTDNHSFSQEKSKKGSLLSFFNPRKNSVSSESPRKRYFSRA